MGPTPFPLQLLEGLAPSVSALLELLCSRMTDAQIQVIAEADYGYKADEARAELVQIIEARRIPERMSTHLHEDLQLHRWCEPSSTDEQVSRALACLYLLTGNEHTTYDFWDHQTTLGILLEGVFELGEAFVGPTLRYLAWRALATYEQELPDLDEDEAPEELELEDFVNCGLLLVMIRARCPTPDIAQVFGCFAGTSVVGEGSSAIAAMISFLASTRERSTRPQIWLGLCARTLDTIEFIEDAQLRASLGEVARASRD